MSGPCGNRVYKFWFDDDIEKAIKDRKDACKKHRKLSKNNHNINNAESELSWQNYQSKRKAAKLIIRQKIMDKRLAKSMDLHKKGGPSCKDFWKILRGSTNNKNNIYHLKAPNSNDLIYDRTKMNQTIMQHFNSLGKMYLNFEGKTNSNPDISEYTVEALNLLSNFPQSDDDNECLSDINISIDDIKDALSKCKNGKAPGLDNITNEMLKNGGNVLINYMHALFNKLLLLERAPDEWNMGIIIPIHKKGRKDDLNNYRGITLNSCVAKIYNRIFATAISDFAERTDLLTETQGGFRTNHQCQDHIFTLKSITATRLSEGKKTFLAFLDFKKAFDTVWRDGLLVAAWNSGIKGKLWRILNNLYNNVQCMVKFGDIETNLFAIDDGLKQGCVLSPVLFNIFINNLTKMLKNSNTGVEICNIKMNCLLWADDVVLIADNARDLQKMLDIASSFAHMWRLTFNLDKSNVLTIGKRANPNNVWRLGKGTIYETNSYKYLGIHINYNLSDHLHINEVIRKGHRIIAYIKSIIDNQDNFNRVYYGDLLWRTIGLPTINYACSTWVCGGQTDINRLENLQYQMARYILKIPINTAKGAIYGDLGWDTLSSIQDTQRVSYFYRLLNMNSNRWPKVLFNFMFNAYERNNGNIRWKWLSCIRNRLTKCGLDHSFNNFMPENINNRNWLNTYKSINHDIEIKDWINCIVSKSSLFNYTLFKQDKYLEPYLLDKTDFQGVNLKFRARTNTLQIDNNIRSWAETNDGVCRLCNSGLKEDINHFLFTCKLYNDIRIEEFCKLERELINANCNHAWECFISNSNPVKLYFTLGDIYQYDDVIGRSFDMFSKSYLKKAWTRRNSIIKFIHQV